MSELSTQPRFKVREESLTFPHISGLLSLAEDYPRLLPVVVEYLSAIKLSVLLRPDQQFTVIKLGHEDNNILIGLNNSMLEHTFHQYPEHIIHSIRGRDIVDLAIKVARDSSNMGLALIYGYNDQIEYLHLPSRLFKAKDEDDLRPHISEAKISISKEIKRELDLFFEEYPEVKEVYYAEQIKNRKRNPCILIISGKQSFDNGFIFTVPGLILEKQGFKPNTLAVFFDTVCPDRSLPFERIYQIK